MSTRGTYLIAANPIINHSICFYVHSDNYPEGAAHYFRKMHYYKNSRGYYAGRFFRANSNAEFTISHSSHGDTEYCYTLDAKGQLTVLHESASGCSNKWVTIYKGSWYAFVNQQLPDEEKLYLFKTTDGKDVMTLTEAKNHISSKQVLAKEALNEGAIMNARDHEEEAKFFQVQVNAILKDTKLKSILKPM